MVRISQTCGGVIWVNVGIGKSLCLCQVPPRLVPWGAKLPKPGHSGFLQRWCFLPRSNASQEKACPVLVQYWPSTGQSTGQVLVQYWAECWPNTGPVLVIIMVMDWSSAEEIQGMSGTQENQAIATRKCLMGNVLMSFTCSHINLHGRVPPARHPWEF